MEKESGVINEVRTEPRGWDALEAKLKARGLSALEIADARKSFASGIELLSKMFLLSYGDEKKDLV
ncbi:MAG: hypothetical protein ACOY3K_05760 [Candidatus Omnitrophota bacterium]